MNPNFCRALHCFFLWAIVEKDCIRQSQKQYKMSQRAKRAIYLTYQTTNVPSLTITVHSYTSSDAFTHASSNTAVERSLVKYEVPDNNVEIADLLSDK